MLQLRADEIVERIDVLSDEATDLEERGHQMPFALQALDGLGQLFGRDLCPGRRSCVSNVPHDWEMTKEGQSVVLLGFSVAILRNLKYLTPECFFCFEHMDTTIEVAR